LATLCGAVADSFQKGAELLDEARGVALSESTVQRTTEATGQHVARTLAGGTALGSADPWAWHRDALGQAVGYIGLDATGVRQQAPDGHRGDGRMAHVGMIFNPHPDPERVFESRPKPGEPMRARYISGLYPLADMGPLLRRQGAEVGLDGAEVWVALSDGGAGLEDLLRDAFPRVEAVILDFYHAAEHLGTLATALHPHDEVGAWDQMKVRARVLRDEGGEVMIAVLENWDWPNRKGLGAVRAGVLG
jgi:hypothetical protein